MDGSVAFVAISTRDLRLWGKELMPVVLVAFDAAKGRAYWLHIQPWIAASPPRPGAATASVHIPATSVVNKASVKAMGRIKNSLTTISP